MRVTIKQIAQELGISEAAVSLALNQRPGVSDATRKRVISCAKTLGYDMGHLRAQGNRNHTVMLMHFQKRIHHHVDFFATLLGMAERELRNSGVSFQSVTVDAGSIEQQLEHGISQDCAGIIILATELDASDWHYFSELEVPVVLLDAYIGSIGVSCVTINNREGARQATQLLLSEGRGCPGLLDSTLPLASFRERGEAFFSAIRDAGYPTAAVQTLKLSPYVDGSEIDLSERLDAGLVPATGYVAVNDHVAIGAMRALQAHGYRIPEDVSIVGFDNTELASYISPALTSLNVPLDYYSHLAVRLLLDLMDGAEQHPIRVEVTPTLVRRASTR